MKTTMSISRPPRDAIRFRPIAPEDTPFLRRVYGTTREEEMRAVPWTEEQKKQFVDMQFAAQKQHYEQAYPSCDFLVIELDGESIGRLYIDRDETDIYIIDIALLPEHRRRGVGGMLLEEILEEGRTTGKKVQIYVEHDNPARHLYDRLGFRHVDSNGIYHKMEWRAADAT
jgi:ribosomal protein S18 acetylase RimI-like enzyme